MALSLALEASIQTSTHRTAVNGMFDFFNRPQLSCGKVMFLHVSVILLTGVGRGSGRQTPPSPDGHYSRRYASYWNAFLFFY